MMNEYTNSSATIMSSYIFINFFIQIILYKLMWYIIIGYIKNMVGLNMFYFFIFFIILINQLYLIYKIEYSYVIILILLVKISTLQLNRIVTKYCKRLGVFPLNNLCKFTSFKKKYYRKFISIKKKVQKIFYQSIYYFFFYISLLAIFDH